MLILTLESGGAGRVDPAQHLRDVAVAGDEAQTFLDCGCRG